MDANVVWGITIIVVVLVANAVLVFVSMGKIEQIATKRLHSVRDIVRGLSHER